MSELTFLPITVVVIVGLVAGAVDAWKYRVHNILTVPLLITGVLYNVFVDGALGLTSSAEGAAFGLLILAIPYLLGGIGGGDVKLMAGIGAWLGMPATVWVFIVSGLAACLYSIVMLVIFGGYNRVLVRAKIAFYQLRAMGGHLGTDERVEAVVCEQDRRRRLIPFAAMIAVGVIAVVIWSRFAVLAAAAIGN